MRTLILTVVLLSLIVFSLFASARSNSGGLAERVAELEAQMKRVAEFEAQVEVLAAALQEAQAVLQYVHVETEEIRGVTGPHWIIEGANVHVRSGSGQTYPRVCPRGYPGCISTNGLGNLIVGYNEVSPSGRAIRFGMHNLVVGPEHEYFSSYGGFVAGRHNSISITLGASVSGGKDNEASNSYSSVSGGIENLASGSVASVSGGYRNVASGRWSSVSGGEEREARNQFNWAAGNLFEEN